MRILHTADWHLGKKLDFYHRLEEQKAVLQEIIQIAEEQAVDLVIVAGDLFDNFNPSNEAMELLYKTLKKLAKNGKVPVIAIAGNHDSPDRIKVPDILARENGIIFIGSPTEKVPIFQLEDGFKITQSDIGFLEIQLPQHEYPIRVLHTAFANEVRLKEHFGADKQKSLQDSLSEKWQYLADKYCDDKGVNVLTTHLFMQKRGEKIEEEPEGEKPLNIGNADLIYSDVVPKNIQYAALGHLHNRQNIGIHQPVLYSSSLLRYSFSEANKQKYVIIIDVVPGMQAEVKPIPISGGKKLERKTFGEISKAVEWLQQNQEALIELTIESEQFMTAQEQRELRQANDGIIFLIPKVKNKTDFQSENKQINLSDSMDDLFKQYFAHKNNGQLPNEEIMDLLNEILNAE